MSFSDTLRSIWAWTRVVFAATVGVFLLLLIALNFSSVSVRYVFGEIQLPLAVVIVLAGLMGAGVYAVRGPIGSMLRMVHERIAARRAVQADPTPTPPTPAAGAATGGVGAPTPTASAATTVAKAIMPPDGTTVAGTGDGRK